MRCFRVVLICLGLWATAANALCEQCDEVVELDDQGVGCLRAQLAQRLPPPGAAAPERYSLEQCGADASGGRGGLLTMPRLVDGVTPVQKLQVVYAFDHRFAVCLLDLLSTVPRPVEATVTFDLFELCRG